MKGISPLIAAVLLIAFTMAIGGIMATWATTFSREKLSVATEESDCIGAIDLSSLSFSNGTVSVRIKNVSDQINLTGFRATVEYADLAKSKEYILKDYNVTDPLPPAAATFFVVSTGSTEKPQKMEVVAGNCPRHAGILSFR